MAVQRRFVVVAYLDGRQERYPLTPAVDMEFERTYKVSVNRMDDGAAGATNMYRLAWLCARRHGGVTKVAEDWANDIEGVDVETEDIAPFVAGAPAADSQNSASQLESLPAS